MKKTRFEKLKEKYPTLTRDRLYQLYIVEEKSLPMLYREFGIDYNSTLDFLKYYGIPKRSFGAARTTKSAVKRMTKILETKYGNGITNVSQLDAVKEQKKKTFVKHYGVDNIWKSKEYYEWLNDYMLLRYGVKRISTNPWGWQGVGQHQKKERIKKLWLGRDKWWDSLNDEEKYEFMAKLCKSSSSVKGSKIETRICNALNRLHISHQRWYRVGRKIFDFKIDNTKILIEANGDFWHANPTIYKDDSILPFPRKPVLAKDLWEKDKNKQILAKQKGYQTIYIWEADLKNMTDKDLDIWVGKLLFDTL